METQDFTRLPLGSLVASSRTVIRCPQCRRHGVLESSRDGSRRCIHVETVILPGMVPQPTDRCEFAGPRSVLPQGMRPSAIQLLGEETLATSPLISTVREADR
jgi:hypothetical protein